MALVVLLALSDNVTIFSEAWAGNSDGVFRKSFYVRMGEHRQRAESIQYISALSIMHRCTHR